MTSKPKTRRLGDVLTLRRGHDLPETARQEGDIPVVSSSGITGYHNEAMAEPPGVVTGRYGTLGEVFFLEQDYWPLNTTLYVVDFKDTDPRFASYFLRNALRGYQSDKAAVPGIDRNVLHELLVEVPEPRAQKKIASILSAYDDLIENNTRRIALLEQAARHLYDEWFVRLKFPGHERTRIVDGVPNGWERVLLGKLVTTQYGFTETATTEPIGPRFLRGTDINKTPFIDWSTVPYCPIDERDKPKYALHLNNLVVIRMADPGKVAIVEQEVDAVFASYLVRLRRVDDRITPYYLYYTLANQAYQSFINGVAGGSTRKTASAVLLTRFDLLLPPRTLQCEFETTVRSNRSLLNLLLRQNAEARKARDLLLPRLMSGEIAA